MAGRFLSCLGSRSRCFTEHDPAQPAGWIKSLSYDERGNLCISAHVDHPLARRCCAFSISARVIDYEMCDIDGPDFFARIDQADLTEVSLTSEPANPQAVVTSRHPASAKVQFLDTMKQKVAVLCRLTSLIEKEMRA